MEPAPTKNMKYLFDFDGVLTDQIAEALRVRDLFEATLYQKSGLHPAEIKNLLTEAYKDLLSFPHKHGWITKGRIAAYANEDYFMQNVGLSLCLDTYAAENHGFAKKLLLTLAIHGFKTYFDISQQAYAKMVAETQANAHKPLDAETKLVFDKILNKGDQIVIVSNSSTERILNMLEAIQVKAVDHTQNQNAPLRVRGSARKFDLHDDKTGFFIGDYWIDTARPSYSKIILEETPSVFVGDVLSLDLATPYFLATQDPDKFGDVKLCLRAHEYTPLWSRDFIEGHQAKNAHFRVISKLSGVLTFPRNS